MKKNLQVTAILNYSVINHSISFHWATLVTYLKMTKAKKDAAIVVKANVITLSSGTDDSFDDLAESKVQGKSGSRKIRPKLADADKHASEPMDAYVDKIVIPQEYQSVAKSHLG